MNDAVSADSLQYISRHQYLRYLLLSQGFRCFRFWLNLPRHEIHSNQWISNSDCKYQVLIIFQISIPDRSLGIGCDHLSLSYIQQLNYRYQNRELLVFISCIFYHRIYKVAIGQGYDFSHPF